MSLKKSLALLGLIECLFSANGQEIAKKKGNIELTLQNHSVRVENLENLGRYSVSIIREEDGVILGNGMASEEGTCFRYFPERFIVRLSSEDEIVEESEIIENKIFKTIVVDREARPQKAYLIEGDEFNPFGFIIGDSLISTGSKKRVDSHPTDATPLGYYYIKGKEENAYNGRNGRKWKMPFALWYTRKAGTPEGINGLHAYEKTKFGYPASHGCVREPINFAKFTFEWTEVGTPLFIIGNKRENCEDKNRFDFKHYHEIHKRMIELSEIKEEVKVGDYSRTLLSLNEIEDIKRNSEFIRYLRRLSFKEQVF